MKKNSIPMRRCAACMESKSKQELIRIAHYEGKLTVDRTGRANGRGMYLCNNSECFEKAKKRRVIQRNLGIDISQSEIEKIFEELADER